MSEYFIHIHNKSPMLLGSGKGFTNMVDSDLVFDDYGFPVFPAKRLKGLLRESAFHLIQQCTSAGWKSFFPSIEEIFGDDTKEGSFHIYDGILADRDSLIDHLDYLKKKYPHFFSSQTILETFTTLRHQTALEDGVALKHSLRTSRVLKKGHRFAAPIVFEKKRDDKAIPLLALAAKNLRYVGLNRNRGFGQVQCFLEEKGQKSVDLSQEAIKRIQGGMEHASY